MNNNFYFKNRPGNIYVIYTYIKCTGVFKEIKIKALLFCALYKQYNKIK